jgi:hypothetical protein
VHSISLTLKDQKSMEGAVSVFSVADRLPSILAKMHPRGNSLLSARMGSPAAACEPDQRVKGMTGESEHAPAPARKLRRVTMVKEISKKSA